MFVGHYSVSFVAKAAAPRVPLWVLLIAAQLVDVIWAGLVLVGVERLRLDPTLPSNPLVLEYMPYTHSLLGTLVWAALAGGVVARLPRLAGTARAGTVVAAVVASHWLLDLVVHRHDLTLWGGGARLGFALWDYPAAANLLEIALLAGSVRLYARLRDPSPRARRTLVWAAGALVLVQIAPVLGVPPPASPAEMATTVLAVFVVVAAAGGWMDGRMASRRPAPDA